MNKCYSGEAIAAAILSEVDKAGLDMSKCCGQAYDGAANMSGANKGAATTICAAYPYALYTHCKAHVLNLVLVKACQSVRAISKYFY